MEMGVSSGQHNTEQHSARVNTVIPGSVPLPVPVPLPISQSVPVPVPVPAPVSLLVSQAVPVPVAVSYLAVQPAAVVLTPQQERVPARLWPVQGGVVLLEPVLVGARTAALVAVRAVDALLLAHPAQVPLAAVGGVVAGFSEDFDAGGYLA